MFAFEIDLPALENKKKKKKFYVLFVLIKFF